MLGLPATITACLFDLDGVLTDTASVHRGAWKQTFDTLLADRGLPEFTDADYNAEVDGKPRADGVRDFLKSRGISLPDGQPDDKPGWDTVNAIGNRKNELLLHRIATDGVTVYEGSQRYLVAAKAAGLRRFVVSSSANTEQVLKVTGLAKLVEGRIDGKTLVERHLAGKPAPDGFIAGAELAGVDVDAAAVFEDATSGVAAGRAGHFGYVVGVNRLDDHHGKSLRDKGADIVVADLGELL